MMKIKVGMISLGCAKNQVDAEVMLGNVRTSGFEITSSEDAADAIIINTCGFIDSAKDEAINAILEVIEKKEAGSCKYIIVSGCLAQRYTDDIIKEFPEVDAVIGVGGYDKICEVLDGLISNDSNRIIKYNKKIDNLEYLNRKRVLTTPLGSAYLKIAEGCDNRCSYCAIPGIRGSFISRNIESIIEESRQLSLCGVKELILIAQDTTRYGKDLYKKPMLQELVTEISKIEGIEWIRIMYLYPDEVTAELVELIKNNEKVCKYVDLPIQHISDNILNSMNRRGSKNDIIELFTDFRKEISEVVLRTSIIVGFPGETEEDFELLKKTIKEIKFDRMGIFTYSREENTLAAKLKGQIPSKIKKQRYNELMAIQQEISLERNQMRVGKEYKTLVEGIAEDGIFYFGRTYGEAPEVDGKMYFTSKVPINIGDMVNVKVIIAEEYDLTGEVTNEFTQ